MKSIIEFIKEFFREKSTYDTLEAYIAARNPQGPGDVEKFEREFWDKRHRIDTFDRYY